MNQRVFARWRGGSTRLTRERRTVEAMLRIYCRGQHGGARALCPQCQDLHAYAVGRIERCPYADDKPACVDCPIHCYRADRRQEIRRVMRYAGPRMLWRHPWLAIHHMLTRPRAATKSKT